MTTFTVGDIALPAGAAMSDPHELPQPLPQIGCGTARGGLDPAASRHLSAGPERRCVPCPPLGSRSHKKNARLNP